MFLSLKKMEGVGLGRWRGIIQKDKKLKIKKYLFNLPPRLFSTSLDTANPFIHLHFNSVVSSLPPAPGLVRKL